MADDFEFTAAAVKGNDSINKAARDQGRDVRTAPTDSPQARQEELNENALSDWPRSARRCSSRGAAIAQQYPTKPVKIIIPFPAGGVTDIAGRLIAQKLSERLGQQFYIENIAGAGGNLGMGNVGAAAWRRLHDPAVVLEHRGQPEPLRQGALRHRQGLHPGHQGRRHAELVGRQCELPGEDDEGADRPDQARARQVQRRLARHRHDAVAVDRNAASSRSSSTSSPCRSRAAAR